MMLRTVRMHDFGLYAGVNAFDLVPRRGADGSVSPIVLVGGRNGAGKTTLLEAVRLALYGRGALGSRVSQGEYEAHLLGRLHKGGGGAGGATSAAVEVEFDYAEAGVLHHYHVKRDWAVAGKGVVEHLRVDKDGSPIASVPREEWHQFLQELVPPGVSQLFFFDGEKIQDIAEGEDDGRLAEAVRGLLGIELVDRLRADVGLYLARRGGRGADDDAARLGACERALAVSEVEAERLAGEAADLAAMRESQARAAERVRLRFTAEGGDEAARRGHLEAERDEARRCVSRVEHEVRSLANGLLPLAMAPKVVASFRDALARSGAGGERGVASRALADALMGWRSDGRPTREAKWGGAHWADLDAFLSEWVGRGTTSNAPALREVGDGAAALERLTEVEAVAAPRARALAKELEALMARQAAAEEGLLRADNAASGLLLDELRSAEQQVGRTEAALSAKRGALQEVRGRAVTLRRDRDRLLAGQAARTAADERTGLAARVAGALVAYEERLLASKLDRLEAEFAACFKRLARKKDLVASVRLDRATFAPTLFGSDGRVVVKAALSAGEKQIYAVAMLWALARASGRPLPTIIDTPLGRLDSEHRANLVRDYFPHASHQVILLSTDTEVEGRLLDELSGAVSHAYRLDYDPEGRRTRPVAGYFGSGDAVGARAGEGGGALQQA